VSASSTRLGLLLVLASGTAFGAVPIAGRYAYDDGAGTLTLLAGRYLLAALTVGVVLALVPSTRPSRVPSAPAVPFRAVLAAATMTIVANVGYLGAVERDDVTRVAPLVFLFPVLVPLAAVACGRERLQRVTVVAASVGVTGSLLAVSGGIALPRDGVAAALALLAAGANAAFILFVGSAVRGMPWAPLAFGMFVLSALVLLPAAVVTGSGTPSTSGWGYVVIAGVLCTGAPYGLWLAGLRLVGESRTAALAVWEPTVSVVLALALLGEEVDLVQGVGIALVLGSLALIGGAAAHGSRRARREAAMAHAR